jgi:hypothetical protein
MSEQNILNPTATSQMNPDYGYTEGLPSDLDVGFLARSGDFYFAQRCALVRQDLRPDVGAAAAIDGGRAAAVGERSTSAASSPIGITSAIAGSPAASWTSMARRCG